MTVLSCSQASQQLSTCKESPGEAPSWVIMAIKFDRVSSELGLDILEKLIMFLVPAASFPSRSTSNDMIVISKITY